MDSSRTTSSSFRFGWKDEEVGGGKRGGQLFAAQVAGEDGGGVLEIFFEIGAYGSVADDGQACAGDGAGYISEFFDLFFGGEAADVEEEALAGLAVAEAAAHLGGPCAGPEELGIDRALP